MQVAGFAAGTAAECQRDSWSLARIAKNCRRNCEEAGTAQEL